VRCVGVLFSRVPFHINRFILPRGGRLGEQAGCRLTSSPVRPGLFSPRRRPFVREVLGTAKLVSQVVDLSDDQVNEGVNQLIKDLQMLVLLEAAQTLPANTTDEEGSFTFNFFFNRAGFSLISLTDNRLVRK
ncbi:hypothetical protein GOODEAATRI_002926, partial [Goodea atripinnis]